MNLIHIDPVSLNRVSDIINAPFVVEGDESNPLKVYFENDDNRLQYLEMQQVISDRTVNLARSASSGAMFVGWAAK